MCASRCVTLSSIPRTQQGFRGVIELFPETPRPTKHVNVEQTKAFLKIRVGRLRSLCNSLHFSLDAVVWSVKRERVQEPPRPTGELRRRRNVPKDSPAQVLTPEIFGRQKHGVVGTELHCALWDVSLRHQVSRLHHFTRRCASVECSQQVPASP